MAALLGAAVWHGAVLAAEPAKKRDMFYYGEREFCLRLLNNADKAVKIEPVFGPTLTFDLDTGELYAPKLRLYFVKSPLPGPFIHRMVKEGNWKAVLGYTPSKADSTAGRIVYDSRWRKYDDQRPGIFSYHDSRDPDEIAATPTEMTLFGFDADGKRDKIYRSENDFDFIRYAAVVFKTCKLKPLLWISVASDFFRFEGKTYIITDGNPYRARRRPVSSKVYRIDLFSREIDRNDDTCYFSGIDRFTDYLRDKHLNHQTQTILYRR